MDGRRVGMTFSSPFFLSLLGDGSIYTDILSQTVRYNSEQPTNQPGLVSLSLNVLVTAWRKSASSDIAFLDHEPVHIGSKCTKLEEKKILKTSVGQRQFCLQIMSGLPFHR